MRWQACSSVASRSGESRGRRQSGSVVHGTNLVKGAALLCPLAGIVVDLDETVVSERLFHSAAHPGGEIGGEVAATAIIETVGRLDERQVGLLHQVGVEITAAARAEVGGDAGCQPQMSLDQLLLDLDHLLRRKRRWCGSSQ